MMSLRMEKNRQNVFDMSRFFPYIYFTPPQGAINGTGQIIR